MSDSTRKEAQSQDPPASHLVGSFTPLADWMKTCPRAKTITGWSCALTARVVIAVTCKNWGCPICGRRKVIRYAKRVAEAKPNRLITLTVNPAMHGSPREAFDDTRRAIPHLSQILRKAYGEFEFFRVLEVTKKGWPHYHLVTRSPYIPQQELSSLWNRLTGAPIVDVRLLKKHENAYWYVVKYLAKQDHVPWTDRRAAWTRKFFPTSDFEAGPSLEMFEQQFIGHHPAAHVSWDHEGCTLERYSDDCWIVRGPTGRPTVAEMGSYSWD
jgi:hypothetical protein